MQRVILLEGPDCCGKTNIARALSKKLKIPYFKNEGEWAYFEKPGDYFVNCMKYGDLGMMSQFLVQTGVSVVLDRGWPSEWVYSKVFKRHTDEHAFEKLDEVYSSLGVKIVIAMRNDYSQTHDQFKEITPAKLNEIHAKYIEFSQWTRCQTFTIHVDDNDLKRELLDIDEFLEGGYDE